MRLFSAWLAVSSCFFTYFRSFSGIFSSVDASFLFSLARHCPFAFPSTFFCFAVSLSSPNFCYSYTFHPAFIHFRWLFQSCFPFRYLLSRMSSGCLLSVISPSFLEFFRSYLSFTRLILDSVVLTVLHIWFLFFP